MNHTGDKAPGAAIVTPAPALGAGKKPHRSNGNYVKSYGRASYENHKAKEAHPLQRPQELLKQVDSNAAAVPRSIDTPLWSFTSQERPGLEVSPLSSPRYNDGEVDASPLRVQSQSYVPKHRRLQNGDHAGASKEDIATAHVPRRTPPLPHRVQQHVDPTAPSAPLQVSASEGAARVLRQHHMAGKENINIGSHNAPSSGGTAAAPAASPQSAPRPTSSAEARQCRVSTTSHSAAAPALAAAGFRHIASGHVRQRPPSLPGASTAPRQVPAASTLTTGAGRNGGSTAARSASKFGVTIKARPVAVTTRKQLAPLGSAATEEAHQHKAPARTPAAAVRERSPVMDAALRYQLDQMKSVLDYVAEVATALSERRRCAAPPQSTEEFRASVVPRRRCGGTSAFSGEPDGGDLDSPDPTVQVHHSGDSVALLSDIHQAATRLLSAFTKLEYAQLSEDVDMPLLERDTVEHSAELLRLVDGVERYLSLHAEALVRQGLEERRYVFRAMHQLVRFIVRMTHEVVLLRDLALRHDLGQALEVWCSFRAGVEAQSQAGAGASDGDALDKPEDATTPSLRPSPHAQLIFPVAIMLTSPFFAWLEERWFPAMREWRRLVLSARQAASSGDIEGAIRRSRQEAMLIDGLEEILRPGETITILLHQQVEQPIEELGKAFSMKRAAMATLREVVESDEAAAGTLSAAQLSKALKAAQAYTMVCNGRGMGDDKLTASAAGYKEDAALVHRAEELLARLQEADMLHRATTAVLLQPAPELATVLEQITRANELLLLWRRAHDATAAQTALAAGTAALEVYRLQRHSGRLSDNPSSLTLTRAEVTTSSCIPSILSSGSSTAAPVPWIGDGFPAFFDVHALYVAHTPGGPWSQKLSTAYTKLCEVFGMLYTKHQARRELELVLAYPAVDDSSTRPIGGLSLSQQVTPRRPTHDAVSPSDTLRASDEGANAHDQGLVGSLGGTTRSRTSDVSATPVLSTPKRASAEKLHQCIQQAEAAGIGGPLVEEARARLRRLETLRLKIHFDAQTRVLPVADAAQAAFHDVYQQIHDFCQTQLQQPQRSSGAERRLRIRYEDTDGDFISLLDQQDWCMMLSEFAPNGCGGVKIELFCDYPTMPGIMNNSMVVTSSDDVQRIGVESELASGDFQTEIAPETCTPPGTAAATGSAAATAATTPEKRTNVFERLASTSKGSAAAPAASGQRKPRTHPHSLGTTSSQRALTQPRARGTGTGAGSASIHSGSPQKIYAACRAPAGGGSGRSKDAPSQAAAGVGAPKTAALTAENLRRNLLPAQAPSRPEDAEATAQNEVRRSGGRPSNDGMDTIAKSAAAEMDRHTAPTALVGASATKAHGLVSNNDAHDDGEQERSTVHLNLDMARRWETVSDDELQLLEMQTSASVSTVHPDRGIVISSSATVRPTELPPRAEPSRNTFTATYCSGRGKSVSERGGGGGADEAVNKLSEADKTHKRHLCLSPSRHPSRWSSDAFSLDDVETVCSERSRMPQQTAKPKGPTSLPPRPVNAGGLQTPQRVRRGARGTPIRFRPDAGDDNGDSDQGDGANASDGLFAEMQRMREANTRAMVQRKPSWH
ncbi:PB1 domain containing protein, putative [Leishmania shawi]|uniref:PB1 domain containing protein n=1 Tax=Leishmania shawi TaxID=5680 RepID=A0ABR3E7J7_9TRYP